MSDDRTERAAALLVAARRDHAQLDALPEDLRPPGAAAAYAIQNAHVAALGARPAGWKVGATNAAAQAMLDWPEPFYGRLFAAETYESPATVEGSAFFRPGVEVEFAFRLARDLPASGAPWDREGVAAAVATVHPAIEIVDSRFSGGLRAGGLALIADNGAHGAFVSGPGIADWRERDLAALRTELRMNGKRVSEGSGANVLGHPLEPLIWLANARAAQGSGLAAGDIITTGSTCAQLGFPGAGDEAEARFAGLGTVSVRFRARGESG